MSKFKVGDEVKIIKYIDYAGNEEKDNRIIGLTGIIKSNSNTEHDGFIYEIDGRDVRFTTFSDEELELVKLGLPPKFILNQKRCESEYFSSIENAKKRLRELKGQKVRLFEIKKELKVIIRESVSVSIK